MKEEKEEKVEEEEKEEEKVEDSGVLGDEIFLLISYQSPVSENAGICV